MSNAVLKPHLISVEDYLAGEEESAERSEFVAGEIFAMTGASLRHNSIALTLAARLLEHLKGQPCRVFISDVKLRIEQADAVYYPDVLVRCAATPLAADARWVTDPTLLVEVLSPSTESIDRREKLAAYRRIPSLQEYVLVAQETPSVEIYRRQGEAGWTYHAWTGEEVAELASARLSLPLNDIYAGG